MTIIGWRRSLLLTGAALCGACSAPATPAQPAPAPDPVNMARVAAEVTEPLQHGSLVDAAFWADPEAPDDVRVLAAAEISGLRIFTTAGESAGTVEGLDASQVAVLPVPGADGRAEPLVLVADAARSVINGYRLDPDGPELHVRLAEPITIDDEITGLCQYTSPLSGSAYLYAATDGGMIHHYELFAQDDRVAARLLRSIPSGKGTAFCAVDARDRTLYVSEEHTGIWALGAEPETDTARQPVDLREPFGSLSDDIKGVAVYPVDDELSYLLVADVARSHLAVYRLPAGERVATVSIDDLGEPEGLAVDSGASGSGQGGGWLAVADESGTDGSDLKLVAWAAVAEAAGLRTTVAGATAERPAAVRPTVETEPVASRGDAADDPAIWVHPDDASRSLVIGTDKQHGLYVYDLAGRIQQFLPDGNMNNVDVRDGFALGGATVALVAASNRSNDSIAVYRLDHATGELTAAADGVLDTGFLDPYGLCLYRSNGSDELYVFVNEGDSGLFRQWRLFDSGNGRVAAAQVREFLVGSQAEGCVADDETGDLYVAEEDVGLWKYSAEPDGGSARTRIDSTGDDGNLTDDVEGVALWRGDDGTGYLIASNQGANNYAVYRRDGDNAFVGHFHVVADSASGIDGASETDGLDLTSAPLGDDYPAGLLVVQDGRNIAPEEGQNFKYVSWQAVAEAMGLR